MARSHAKFFCSIWDDPDWLDLSVPAQHCYKLLLSQRKLTLVGLLAYTPSRWSRQSRGNSLASVEAAIHELEASSSRFVLVDRDTEELLIRTFVVHDLRNLLSNSNLMKGMWRAWEAIESHPLQHEVIHTIPASVWDYKNATPPAQALNLRGQPPPNTQAKPIETDRSDQPLEPSVRTSLSPKPSLVVTSSAANQADLESAQAPVAAAAVDNSNVRLTAEERQQRLAEAVELLVGRELERNPTRNNAKRHTEAVRNGKLGDHHQRGHQLLAADPGLSAEKLADLLESPPPREPSPEPALRSVPSEAETAKRLADLAAYEPPDEDAVRSATARAREAINHRQAPHSTGETR